MIPTTLAVLIAAAAALAAGAFGVLRGRAVSRGAGIAVRAASEREALLAEVARALTEAARRSPEAVRAQLLRAAQRVVPGCDGALLYEESDGALHCVAALGERFAYYAGSRVALDGDALPAAALTAGRRIRLDRSSVAPLHPGDRDAVAFPLALDGGRVASLVTCGRTTFDPESIDRLAGVAEHGAAAYAIALEREADRTRAAYDALTGLLSPRAFRSALGERLEQARFTPAARFALLFIDSDHFKEWNDAYGHAAGDELLRAIAAELRAVAGPQDLCARNGGDEFCVLLADCGKAEAIERAEVLRRRIAGLPLAALRPRPGPLPAIGASIGVAAYPADAATAAALLERADAAMYHTKRTGRDGVSYVDPAGTLARLDAVPA